MLTTTIPNEHFTVERIARTVLNRLNANNLVAADSGQPVFFGCVHTDRLVLAFDPTTLRDPYALRSTALRQKISADLQGRRVIFTGKNGIFLQIGWQTRTELKLESLPLDLTQQPSPLHVPLGTTNKGSLWLSILEIDSAIIGGARRMGKTSTLHGWIQTLINGGQADLVLYDGKEGTEFGRYAGLPGVSLWTNIETDLVAFYTNFIVTRHILFKTADAVNWQEYNARCPDQLLRPTVLILDEVASLSEMAQEALAKIARVGGAAGVYPVVGIQRPDAEALPGQLRANLVTRIALKCASPIDSRIILGRSGAEKLPGAGRILFEWKGKMISAQTFSVSLPESASNRFLPVPILDEKRSAWVQYAVAELKGFFLIREIASHFGIDDGVVNRVATEWGERNLLTPIEYDKTIQPPRRLGRRVTLSLGRMAGLTDLADLPLLRPTKPDLPQSTRHPVDKKEITQ